MMRKHSIASVIMIIVFSLVLMGMSEAAAHLHRGLGIPGNRSQPPQLDSG